MQALRQSASIAIQRSAVFIRPTAITQQIRFDGSDPRSSTSSENHKSGDLNKSKGGDKKGRSTTTDDTDQPGTKRNEWSNPGQMVGNVPSYGKAGGSADAHNPEQGKK